MADPAPLAAPSLEQIEAARVPFREARELQRQGKLDEAVARILDAYQIASTPVIALEAGRLLLEAGRLVRARDMVRGVPGLPLSPRESEAGRDARRQSALLASELDTRIPKISLVERPREVEVLLDGKPFSPADSAAWLGVDPGAHTIVVSANDHPCASIAITLAEGQVRTIDLRDAALSCQPVAHVPTAATTDPSRPATAEPASPPPLGTRRTAPAWPWGGIALASAGVVAGGVGTYVIARTKADYDAVSAGCTSSGCDAAAFEVRHRAHEQANIATVAAGVGAAVLGGGFLWLALGRPGGADASPPKLGIGPAGVSLLVRVP